MQLTSPAFENNEIIPLEYTCDGQNISPPLSISDVPKEAKSLTITLDDPDAPGGTFTHWLLWNIDPKTAEISEGKVPPGAQEGLNSSMETGYTGPCPPAGTHRYIFSLYALNDKLDLPAESAKEELEEAIGEHVIAKSQLVGVYSGAEDEEAEETV